MSSPISFGTTPSGCDTTAAVTYLRISALSSEALNYIDIIIPVGAVIWSVLFQNIGSTYALGFVNYQHFGSGLVRVWMSGDDPDGSGYMATVVYTT